MNDREYRESVCRILGSVSSQMRGSLGNIRSALNRLLPEGGTNPATAASAAILQQSFYRMLRILNNLSLASILTEDVSLNRQCADVAGIVRELCMQAQPLAEEIGLTLTLHCHMERHLSAVDKQKLEHLFWNLLSNAMKFTPSGGQITVTLDLRNGQLVLQVADTGCGISEEMMEIAYERFLHPERMDPQPYGLGLGLPLCRRIAEMHGGRFVLTSRPGEGTTATVSLPDIPIGGFAVEAPAFRYESGFSPVLVGLSDALPYRVFIGQEPGE